MTGDSTDHHGSYGSQASDQEILNDLNVPLDDLYGQLGSRTDGLTEQEADKKLKSYGPNAFPKRKKSALKNILAQIKNLFNVLLVIAAVLSFIIGITTYDAGLIEMGAVILLVVLVSVILACCRRGTPRRSWKRSATLYQ